MTRLVGGMLADGRLFGQIHRLNMLEELSLSGVRENREQVFAYLKGSKHLTEIDLGSDPISTAAVKSLSTCPHLKQVNLQLDGQGPQLQTYQITPMVALEQLPQLQLENLSYSPALIETLAKFKSLKVLKCGLDTDWAPGKKMALRQALPYTELWLKWPILNSDLRKAGPQTSPSRELGGTLPDAGGEMTSVHYFPLRTQHLH